MNLITIQTNSRNYDQRLGQLQEAIAGGAEINVQDEHGWTPLMYAVDAGMLQRCALFIKNGADLNIKNNLGDTALHVACSKLKYNSHLLVIELLIANGADINAKNFAGNQPLFKAVLAENSNVVQQLINAGACTLGALELADEILGKNLDQLKRWKDAKIDKRVKSQNFHKADQIQAWSEKVSYADQVVHVLQGGKNE